jgi:hypothetical protein
LSRSNKLRQKNLRRWRGFFCDFSKFAGLPGALQLHDKGAEIPNDDKYPSIIIFFLRFPANFLVNPAPHLYYTTNERDKPNLGGYCMTRFNKAPFAILLALTLLAFFGQSALAGPGCAGAKDASKSCAVKSCAAKSTCTAVKKASSETKLACCADGKKCTKEECLTKCLEMGLTKEQAEEMWAKHQQAGVTVQVDAKGCSKEDCLKKCMAMGMTKEEAEACWAEHHQSSTTATVTSASASSGCPMMSKASATATQGCTKETCVSKLIASGMSKEEAEAKYAACQAAGKCAGHTKGGACCAAIKAATTTGDEK